MSWSESFTAKTIEDIAEYEPAPNSAARQDGSYEQFLTARDAALELIVGGTLGDVEKHYFNVSLSGHCEPEHVKREGSSPDQVYISVSQAGVRSEVLAG